MKLNTIFVYDLRMCMKGDNPGLKNDQGRQFKEDNCLFITLVIVLVGIY